MNLVSQYVLRVGTYMIFVLLLEGIMPAGSSKKIVKLMVSLLFMYVLVEPVVSWIQNEIPLSALTLEETAWPDTEGGWAETVDGKVSQSYESQALHMVGQGYEKALEEQGLPESLQEEYQIVQIQMGDTIQVTLARNQEVGGLTNRQLHLGRIGSSSEEEEETLTEALSSYWGIPKENLEMRLR